MKIYQLLWSPVVQTPKLFGELLPAPDSGFLLLSIPVVVLLIQCLRSWFPSGRPPLRGLRNLERAWQWITLLLLFTGTYMISCRWTDEVFINLIHPWNLWHHGKFSFSALEKIDGTVESAYYLLLTPFAESRQTLIRANYILSWAIGLGHVAFAYRLFRCPYTWDSWGRAAQPDPATSNLAFPLAIAVASGVYWIEPLAYGFGNGLISLVFIVAASSLLPGRDRRWSYLACLMPLFRPDAILLSGLLAVALFLDHHADRADRLRSTLRSGLRSGLLFAGSLLSLGLYFFSYRCYFGHYLPTPLLFKAFFPWGLKYLDLQIETGKLGTLIASGELLILTGAVLLLAYRRKIRSLTFLLSGLVVLAAFYALATGFGAHTQRRYFLPTYWFALLCIGLELQDSLRKHAIFGPRRAGLAILFALLPSICYLGGGSEMLKLFDVIPGGRLKLGESERLDHFIYAAKILDPVIPLSWKIGLTEMATFPFFLEQPFQLVDFWGYTNREIATSNFCSRGLLKMIPNYLNKSRPEIVWVRTHGPKTLYGYPMHTEIPAEGLLSLQNFALGNHIGDMAEAIDYYDLVWLGNKAQDTILLVRQDKTAIFLRILADAGARLESVRPLDQERFKFIYYSRKPKKLDCL